MSSPAQPEPDQLGDDFIPTEELIRRYQAKPMRVIGDLPGGDPFESDEEHEEFLADLYDSRHAAT